MNRLTPAQRNTLYLKEAERSGIHKPILAALYQVHNSPSLDDGETGLGISPANRVSWEKVNTFAKQVHYAASTIRSMINLLITEGWQGSDLWDPGQGCYSEKLLRAIATGFTPPADDSTAALLEATESQKLIDAYQANLAADLNNQEVLTNQSFLRSALRIFMELMPYSYLGLPQQRDALLEMVRLWRGLDLRDTVLASLSLMPVGLGIFEKMSHESLDLALPQIVYQLFSEDEGYPHQREALLRLVQVWRQLESREAAIVSLYNNESPDVAPQVVDPALMALMQRIPNLYEGNGNQRNALVEGFRLWHQLESRSATLVALGVNPDLLSAADAQPEELTKAAQHLDRVLLDFVRQIPTIYTGTEIQRYALLHLTQLWREVASQEQTFQALCHDLKQMENARLGSPEAPPPPIPLVLPTPPVQWTPDTIQIFAPILPGGSFTWADATCGGTHTPANQLAVDEIIQMAEMLQRVRDRLSRPLQIIRWYVLTSAPGNLAEPDDDLHTLGDAVDFYCEGLTGDQIYWCLAPWWQGGLGRFRRYAHIIHLDAHRDRSRWLR